MDIIIELIFRNFIVNFLGLYARFYFFKLLKSNKSLKYLSGEISDKTEGVSQNLFNVVIGLILFVGISFLIAYLTWVI